MQTETGSRGNWFDAGGAAYAKFRPDYPVALVDFLSTLPRAHRLAVDVGCGNGQLTVQLPRYFAAVVGVDPSAGQVNNAQPQDGVSYARAPAEQLPFADGSVDLITVAQAAHWFDLPAFFGECRRVAAPGAGIALISYGVIDLGPDLNERFLRFYQEEIGRYWPPERRLVDRGYVDIAFPFTERRPPSIAMSRSWNLAELLGYISTWSAIRAAGQAGQGRLLNAFADDLAQLWGEPTRPRSVSWPLSMRVGTL